RSGASASPSRACEAEARPLPTTLRVALSAPVESLESLPPPPLRLSFALRARHRVERVDQPRPRRPTPRAIEASPRTNTKVSLLRRHRLGQHRAERLPRKDVH